MENKSYNMFTLPNIKFGDIIKKMSLYLAFVVIFLVFSLINPNFITFNNILNIIVQSSIIAVIGVGQTMVILTNGIDLSVGSIVAFVGIAVGLMLQAGMPLGYALILAIFISMFIGMLNGSIVAYGKVPSFIVTLGMMGIARGGALALNSGKPVAGLQSGFERIATTSIGPIPIFVVYCLVIYALMYVLLERTKFGRHIYALGGNMAAARLSGVKVKRVQAMVYVLAGIFAGLGSIMLTARLNYATPIAGSGYELDTIAAVVIGGTSLSGGQGKIIGTLIGALMLGMLKNGLTICNVAVYYQQIIIGVVIIMAVFADRMKEKDI